MANQNPNCDGAWCTSATGEVRLLPTGGSGGGNMILCHACFSHEIAFQKDQWPDQPVPKWEDLQVYTGESRIMAEDDDMWDEKAMARGQNFKIILPSGQGEPLYTDSFTAAVEMAKEYGKGTRVINLKSKDGGGSMEGKSVREGGYWSRGLPKEGGGLPKPWEGEPKPRSQGGYFSRGRPEDEEERKRKAARMLRRQQGSAQPSEAREMLGLFEENSDVPIYPCVKCGTWLTLFEFTADPLCGACSGKGKTGAEKVD